MRGREKERRGGRCGGGERVRGVEEEKRESKTDGVNRNKDRLTKHMLHFPHKDMYMYMYHAISRHVVRNAKGHFKVVSKYQKKLSCLERDLNPRSPAYRKPFLSHCGCMYTVYMTCFFSTCVLLDVCSFCLFASVTVCYAHDFP